MTVRLLTYFILVAFLLSCGENKTGTQKTKSYLDTTSVISSVETEKKVELQPVDTAMKSSKDKLIVEDKTKYSKKFL